MDDPVTMSIEPTPESPVGPTPFRRLNSDEPARIVLLQTDSTHFQLFEGFRYECAMGAWEVKPEDLPDTDLASIPTFLSWFASRYGKHTLAALLHDHLVRNGPRLTPPVQRCDADDVFRGALEELGVPFLRAGVMWSAVSFATRWHTSRVARAAAGVWLAAAALGIALLVWGAATVNPVAVAAAAVAPIPFALLWGPRRFRAGVLGGYTLWLIALPALANIAAYYGAYYLAERALRPLRKLRPANRGKTMTAPPPYQAI